MPKITAIKKQEKRDRVNIYLDDIYGFSLSLEEYLKARLSRGQEMGPNEIAAVVKSDRQKKLMDAALKYLTYRPRSESEVRTHLKQKYYEWGRKQKKNEPEIDQDDIAVTVDNVILRLKAIDQVNDERFAEWWIGQRMEFRPKSPRIIAQELVVKGVSREIIDTALRKTQANTESSELENAQRSIAKKLPAFNKLPDVERKRKIETYLARHGYSWDVIKKITKSLDSDEVL